VFYEDRVEPVTPAELLAAQSHGGHDALPAAHDEHEAIGAGASGARHLAADTEDTEGTSTH
jgi:ubiquinol-cytochrome c reductase cytochrome b subunit